jgi:hypothetical protein
MTNSPDWLGNCRETSIEIQAIRDLEMRSGMAKEKSFLGYPFASLMLTKTPENRNFCFPYPSTLRSLK